MKSKFQYLKAAVLSALLMVTSSGAWAQACEAELKNAIDAVWASLSKTDKSANRQEIERSFRAWHEKFKTFSQQQKNDFRVEANNALDYARRNPTQAEPISIAKAKHMLCQAEN